MADWDRERERPEKSKTGFVSYPEMYPEADR